MRKIYTLLLMFVLLCGCSSTPLKKQTFTIELGQDVYANPSIYVKDGVDVSGMSIKTLDNGIKKIDNRFVSGNNSCLLVGTYDFALNTKTGREIPFRIKIKDTQPPTLKNAITTIRIPRGTYLNWSDYIDASDLSGVSYEINPLIDTSVSGSYSIELKVSDRFGNSVVKSISVIVE